jgi:hypothetical protein
VFGVNHNFSKYNALCVLSLGLELMLLNYKYFNFRHISIKIELIVLLWDKKKNDFFIN